MKAIGAAVGMSRCAGGMRGPRRVISACLANRLERVVFACAPSPVATTSTSLDRRSSRRGGTLPGCQGSRWRTPCTATSGRVKGCLARC